jgi:hypothetical protein
VPTRAPRSLRDCPVFAHDASSADATVSSGQTKASTYLSGDFTLAINGVPTSPLNFNAADNAMETAIEALGTGPVTVSRVGPDQTGGYTWMVTFTATPSNYDVPQMT